MEDYDSGVPRGMQKSKDTDEYVKEQLEKNDEMYGADLREQYGEDVAELSNKIIGKLSKEEYEKLMEEQIDIYDRLGHLFVQGYRPMHDVVQDIVKHHHEFLGHFGRFYTPEVYEQLADTYQNDARFVEFFDQFAKGMTPWFADAIRIYVETIAEDEEEEPEGDVEEDETPQQNEAAPEGPVEE